jgi:hypothetical protein
MGARESARRAGSGGHNFFFGLFLFTSCRQRGLQKGFSFCSFMYFRWVWWNWRCKVKKSDLGSGGRYTEIGWNGRRIDTLT